MRANELKQACGVASTTTIQLYLAGNGFWLVMKARFDLFHWSLLTIGVESSQDRISIPIYPDQEFRTNCLRCILELAGHHRRLGRNIPASYERELMAWSGCNSVARSHTVFNVFLEEPVITPALQLPLATSKPREIYKTFSFCCSGSSNELHTARQLNGNILLRTGVTLDLEICRAQLAI